MQSLLYYVVLVLSLLLNTVLANAQDTTRHAVLGPVQTQLDAYNTGDLERFLSAYADTVRVYNYPNEFRYQGKAEMRQRYGRMFANSPGLHCRLVGRQVMGNRVLDHESVQWSAGGTPSEVIAIYTVANGRITEVRFLRP